MSEGGDRVGLEQIVNVPSRLISLRRGAGAVFYDTGTSGRCYVPGIVEESGGKMNLLVTSCMSPFYHFPISHFFWLLSGEHDSGKSPSLMSKFNQLYIAMFNSYVSLPEGSCSMGWILLSLG